MFGHRIGRSPGVIAVAAMVLVGLGSLFAAISPAVAAPTAISIQISPATVTSGDPFQLTATLTDGSGQTPDGGQVRYFFHPADDVVCQDEEFFHFADVIDGTASTEFDSGLVSPGSYRVTAAYINAPAPFTLAQTGCGAAGSFVEIVDAPTTITVQVDPSSVMVGESFDVSSTVTDGGSQVPTGEVDYSIYGPDDDTCSGTPQNVAAPINGGSASSKLDSSTLVAGTYRVIATYDAPDGSSFTDASTTCNATGSVIEISNGATTTIAVQVAPENVTVGDIFDVTAMLSDSSGQEPTGDVTFNFFGPEDPTCSGTPDSVTTPAFEGSAGAGTRATVAGSYRVTVDYSADQAPFTNASTVCGAPGSVVVASAGTSPNGQGDLTLSAQASDSVVNSGEGFRDVATLVTADPASPDPGGILTFRLYGPGDEDCSGPAVFSDPAFVDGSTTASEEFVALEPGRYRWIASYGGDNNYVALASECNDPTQSVLVVDPGKPEKPAGNGGKGGEVDNGKDNESRGDGASGSLPDTGAGQASMPLLVVGLGLLGAGGLLARRMGVRARSGR